MDKQFAVYTVEWRRTCPNYNGVELVPIIMVSKKSSILNQKQYGT